MSLVKPLVSILIPCFNSERWLSATIESTLKQTWKNKEIIVVDDGSTDNSLSAARQFESVTVKVISQDNSGASAARNTALNVAQGEYIQYLDADDLLAPDKIEHQIKLLESYPGYVASGAWGRFHQIREEARFVHEPVWNNFLPVDWLVSSWMGGGMMHPAAWLLPRKVVDAAGPWNSDELAYCPNDDGEYFCRVVLASNGIRFCSDAKTYYRSGLSNSLSGRRSRDAIKSVYRSLEICVSHLLSEENNDTTRGASAALFQRFVYSIYPNEPEIVSIAEHRIAELGGSSLDVGGGRHFNNIKRVIGWKMARRIQLVAKNLVRE